MPTEIQGAAEPSGWTQSLRALTDDMVDGRIKLYLIWRTLQLRGRWPEVFRDGDYLPLSASGRDAAHVCAYARRRGERTAITVVPRLSLKRRGERGAGEWGNGGEWGDTRLLLPSDLAGAEWFNVLTGERLLSDGGAETPALALERLLAHFPVALLAQGPDALLQEDKHE